MNHKKVFCFSGQGSQYYRMGKELFDENTIFSLWMHRLDEIVKPLLQESIVETLYNENAKISDSLDRTMITHPAIFMFEYSLYQYFIEKQIYPDCVLGASLGEFTSAAVSGILDYEDVLKMVIKQAEIIDKTCPEGGMMAFLYRLDYFNELKNKYPDIELASINSDNHFVISGSRKTLVAIDQMVKDTDIIAQILPVKHAFHSKFIDPAAGHYHDFLTSCTYKKPDIQYISCATGSFVDSPEIFEAGYFWDICRNPILIKETIMNIEKNAPFMYLDLGPAGTFINLIKQNLNESSGSITQAVISPFGRDMININKAVKFLRNS